MIERWRAVVGYEDKYEVSDLGRVRSVRRIVVRNNGKPHTVPPRVLRQHGGGSDGMHQRVKLYDRKPITKTVEVATIVLSAFAGQRPSSAHQCCHKDGDPLNNRSDNLRWGTRSDNALDSVIHGTHNQARKTHCPQGHVYNAVNTRMKSCGRRVCRECARVYSRKRYRTRSPLKVSA